jgi:phosphomevalonate kinase
MNKTMIIGISSKMGCGKDFITEHYFIPFLENKLKLKTLQVSLADQIKVNVMTKEGISYEDVFIKKNETTRQLLQKEGTEFGRDVFGKDIWIKYYQNWIQILQGRGVKAITTCDIRFKNELEWFKSQKNTVLIRIHAPKRNHQRLLQESNGDKNIYDILSNHISECDLDDIKDDQFDYIVKNDPEDTLDFSILYKKLSQIHIGNNENIYNMI